MYDFVSIMIKAHKFMKMMRLIIFQIPKMMSSRNRSFFLGVRIYVQA